MSLTMKLAVLVVTAAWIGLATGVANATGLALYPALLVAALVLVLAFGALAWTVNGRSLAPSDLLDGFFGAATAVSAVVTSAWLAVGVGVGLHYVGLGKGLSVTIVVVLFLAAIVVLALIYSVREANRQYAERVARAREQARQEEQPTE